MRFRKSIPSASIIIFLVLTLALLAAPARCANDEAPIKAASFESDWQAFTAEIDGSYPFFELKQIAADWIKCKEELGRKIKTCRTEAEFLAVVADAIRVLRDAHMGFTETKTPLPKSPPEYYPGIAFAPATEKRVVVLAGPPNNKELACGVVVRQIDKKPARDVLEEKAAAAWKEGGCFSSPQRARLFEYRLALRGKKGDAHTLTIETARGTKEVKVSCDTVARGWPHTYNMPAGLTQSGPVAYGPLASGVGYIYLRYVDVQTEAGIAKALGAHPDSKGWLIDLRGNGGGGYDAKLVDRMGSIPKPVAVLIDAGCISAGETLARDFVQTTSARLFGETSAGASSAKKSWVFPSGRATLTLPTRSRVGLNRRPIEFYGIVPDEEAEAVPQELRSGKNSGILRAEEWLLKQR